MSSSPDARVDLHCHSSASEEARLGAQRSLGLPECATDPEEVYELAKRRGMDFVTITDHDTIDGVLKIADRPDVFISEELTVRFRGEPQAVHVLCYAITPDDHAWLQRNAGDVETCAAYLREHDITSALAHPFYTVEAPLAPRHRRRLAELFPIWETRNGSRAPELNMPAAIYIDTHGGTGIAGSDDHAGIDIGRTYTSTPAAGTAREYLDHLRAGRATACGDQGGAAKWAHAGMALAVRVLGHGSESAPDPRTVLALIERIVSQGSARSSAVTCDLGPEDGRALLEAWLQAAGLEQRGGELIAFLQADGFSHGGLFRRARRVHERRLARAVERVLVTAEGDGDWFAAATGLFEACMPAIPYAPAAAFLGREKQRLTTRESEPPRVALVADGIGGTHGVTRVLEEIRDRGVPGYEVEVIGTDANVDRRLTAVAEVDIPFYAGLKIGVPSLPAVVETLAEGRYDIVHLCSPGPSGVAAALFARVAELPVIGSYHTELATYAGVRAEDPLLQLGATAAIGAFYRQCRRVLSPSSSADRSLRDLGIPAESIMRWERGVDLARFNPEKRQDGRFPGELNVLYAGRLTKEKGVDLLADAFLAARERDPRLHLVLAGGGPEEHVLRARLGEAATFLGWLEGDDYATAHASADVFLFASRTDTYGQVLLEAQASGVPIVAVAEGGPLDLVDHGRSGRLCAPRADALAEALVELAASPETRERYARGASSIASRGWDRALAQLAAGYDRVLTSVEELQLAQAA